jgi:hypothetical protein
MARKINVTIFVKKQAIFVNQIIVSVLKNKKKIGEKK